MSRFSLARLAPGATGIGAAICWVFTASWLFGALQRDWFGFDPASPRHWSLLRDILASGALRWSWRAWVLWPSSWIAGIVAVLIGAWAWYRVGANATAEQLAAAGGARASADAAISAGEAAPAASPTLTASPSQTAAAAAPQEPPAESHPRAAPTLDTSVLRPVAATGSAGGVVDDDGAGDGHDEAAPRPVAAVQMPSDEAAEPLLPTDELASAAEQLREEIGHRREMLAEAEAAGDGETADFLAEKLGELEFELAEIEAALADVDRADTGRASPGIQPEIPTGILVEARAGSPVADAAADAIEHLARLAYGEGTPEAIEAEETFDVALPGSAWQAAASAAILSRCTPGPVEILTAWSIPAPAGGVVQPVDLLAVTDAGIIALIGWDRPSSSIAVGTDEEAWADGDGRTWLSAAARAVLASARLHETVPAMLLGLSETLDAMIRGGDTSFIRVVLFSTRLLPERFDRDELDARSIAIVGQHDRLTVNDRKPLDGLVDDVWHRLMSAH